MPHEYTPDNSCPLLRTCTTCKRELPLSAFHRQKAGPKGLRCACKDCTNAANRAHYRETSEERLERIRQYRASKPEQHRETNRLWREANKERFRAGIKAWRLRNLERHQENQRRWCAENRELRRSYAANRRARVRQAPGQFSANDVQAKMEAQKKKCYWCDEPLTTGYEIDHVIPLSRGGSNDPSNIVLACIPCNRKKHNKLPHEWDGTNRLI